MAKNLISSIDKKASEIECRHIAVCHSDRNPGSLVSFSSIFHENLVLRVRLIQSLSVRINLTSADRLNNGRLIIAELTILSE